MSAPLAPPLGESVALGRVRGYATAKPGVDLPAFKQLVPVPVYATADEVRAEFASHARPITPDELVIVELRDVDVPDAKAALDAARTTVALGPVRGYAFGRADADLVAEGEVQCAVYTTELEARAASTPRCPCVVELREVDPR